MNQDIRKLINEKPMSGFQIAVIAICLFINMLDGFDVLVIAFTAPSISNEWGLSGTELGIVLSAGFVGMAVGAMFLAPLADRVGRRNIVIASLFVIGIGMLLSGLTENVLQLALARGLTGIGIGASLASLNIIVAEYSSTARRGLCISLLQIAYPLGAIFGGTVAAFIISEAGWRPVFLFGGFLTFFMIPIVYWRLPESIDFLLATRPADTLSRLNRLLTKLGHKTVDALPELTVAESQIKPGFTNLWSADLRSSTFLAWTTFFMTMFCVYFVLSWTPKLLVTAGLSVEQGISGGLILNLGGIVGQLLLGFVSARFNLRKLISGYMALAALAMIGFGLVTQDLSIALIMAVFIGFFLFGTITGAYILTPRLYPAEIRTTGMGWAIGIGRLGAIISPYLTGVLLDANWSISFIFFIFALPMIIGIIVLHFISVREQFA